MSTMMNSPPLPANTAPSGMSGGNPSVIALATMGLSSNKYILGIMILLINLGARYIGNELNEFSHKVLNHKFARRFLIFLVIWMGSRDLIVSLVITTCFILLSNTLLNEQSDYCILPITNSVSISKEEYDIAKQMVQKYEASHPAMPPAPGMHSSSQQTQSNCDKPTVNVNISKSMPVGNNQINQE
jgi:hypothetical protein